MLPSDQPLAYGIVPTDVGHGLRLLPGKARVSENGIVVHHNTPDFLAIEIDMASKYVQPMLAHGMEEPSEVWLMAFQDALFLDDTTERQTLLLLPEHTQGWTVLATGGRYTIQIAAWRRPDPVED